MSTSKAVQDLDVLRVRHEVTNALLRYLRAVDDHDVDAVVAELGRAKVSFGGPVIHGLEELTETYRDAFTASGRTRHHLHAVEAEVDEHGGAGRAAYQRWSLDTDSPTLTALGHYEARLAGDDNQWHLSELTVHRYWQHPPAHVQERT